MTDWTTTDENNDNKFSVVRRGTVSTTIQDLQCGNVEHANMISAAPDMLEVLQIEAMFQADFMDAGLHETMLRKCHAAGWDGVHSIGAFIQSLKRNAIAKATT